MENEFYFENDPMMEEYDSRYEIEETEVYFGSYFDQYDDDPNPYNGTYSEE